MAGGGGWQDWIISVKSHLTPSDMRYFDVDDADAAWTWVQTGQD